MPTLVRRRGTKRPLLYTSYDKETALLNTRAKRNAVFALLLVAMALPFVLDDSSTLTIAKGSAYAVGALGLGLLTGYAGQVSLGHAFFAGVGFYTAAVVGGDPEGQTWGLGYSEVLIWLPAAGIAAALVGIVVAPLATRLRGLYLAIVTLGLVFIGEHFFRHWRDVTGGLASGRPAPPVELFGYRLDQDGGWFTEEQHLYWLLLVLLVIFAIGARNIARSNIGRAFTAIRDRDIAAGVIGVNLVKQKTIAFAISSFYAGCGGALFYITIGHVNPNQFVLFLSILFIVMVLIGGAGTISGAIAGAYLIAVLPPVTTWLADILPGVSSSPLEVPNDSHLQFVLYGLLIIGFLIFEPRGLFGIWVRLRNWWKSFPFSY